MRITLESDYAMRIISELAKCEKIIDAKTLSDLTSVTQRFTLKILHKLVGADIVSSYKGVNGGYKLKKSAEDITLKEIIELIDGPIAISRCIGNGQTCALNGDKLACELHHIFDKISFDLAAKLQKISIKDVIDKRYEI